MLMNAILDYHDGRLADDATVGSANGAARCAISA
jgi:hypothetical protein